LEQQIQVVPGEARLVFICVWRIERISRRELPRVNSGTNLAQSDSQALLGVCKNLCGVRLID
jgi:hypothetical protein